MRTLKYISGEPACPGDQVRYHGEPGQVEFVVSDRTGDPALDWYVDQYPGGGLMIIASGFGRVFLPVDEMNDFLELVSRA